jgi:hypothetical protein
VKIGEGRTSDCGNQLSSSTEDGEFLDQFRGSKLAKRILLLGVIRNDYFGRDKIALLLTIKYT